jgi:hypothetical protein
MQFISDNSFFCNSDNHGKDKKSRVRKMHTFFKDELGGAFAHCFNFFYASLSGVYDIK